MSRAVVYVGPSLTAADLAGLPCDRLDVRPPIKRGELLPVVEAGCRLIAMIDGNFLQDIAVSPKEVWEALSRGTTIVGGASIGALRAVELRPFGMIGIGHVYEWYRSGRLNRDDDVGVTYSSDGKGYRTHSVPMVNVIWVVDQTRKNGILDHATSRRVVSKARRIDWRERTWPAIWHDTVMNRSLPSEFRAFALDSQNDRKRLDAKLVIDDVLVRCTKPNGPASGVNALCGS